MAKGKGKTLTDVYTNADKPHTPAMQKYVMDLGREAAAEPAKKERPVKETGFSDKDEDYEF